MVYFDNLVCLVCGSDLAYSRAERMVTVGSDGRYRAAGGSLYRRCANIAIGCNWLVEPGVDPQPAAECYACRLTRTRPGSADDGLLAMLAETTQAKRWLIYQLDDLGLPIVSHMERPDGGLAFDLAASTDDHKVMIGHLNGVIAIDLTEAQDSHREALRHELGEAYRTMLGHFRHEIGHYYWQLLVQPDAGRLERFRALFGDERQDYSAALDAHYGGPEQGDWHEAYISQYATTHPWEDFAETFAHYLHITDTLQSAAWFGMRTAGLPPDWPGRRIPLESDPQRRLPAGATMTDVLTEWQPLALALNLINRSMGKDDLYPFTIADPVAAKLAFVHGLVGETRG